VVTAVTAAENCSGLSCAGTPILYLCT
jgi:hypothetical protein